jgi:glycosyltransferase involved in cell wall biosynthesis
VKISVCLPVIGRLRFLEEALYSLLGQSHSDWELVVKDGDPEAPVANDERIKTLFGLVGASRLRYKVSRDAGVFYAFNDCIERATGDIVNCMCSDDLMVPGALAAVNAEFERDRFPTMFWLYGKTVSADHTGKKLGVDGSAATYDGLLEHNRMGLPAVFWSKGLMRMEGGFDTRYHFSADYELYLRTWRRRAPMFLDQELGVFRHHETNFSSVHRDELEAEAKRISQRHRYMADVISEARCETLVRRAYGGDGIPESVN